MESVYVERRVSRNKLPFCTNFIQLSLEFAIGIFYQQSIIFFTKNIGFKQLWSEWQCYSTDYIDIINYPVRSYLLCLLCEGRRVLTGFVEVEMYCVEKKNQNKKTPKNNKQNNKKNNPKTNTNKPLLNRKPAFEEKLGKLSPPKRYKEYRIFVAILKCHIASNLYLADRQGVKGRDGYF